MIRPDAVRTKALSGWILSVPSADRAPKNGGPVLSDRPAIASHRCVSPAFRRCVLSGIGYAAVVACDLGQIFVDGNLAYFYSSENRML